ncbi:rhamnogalacturonan acetylesterase [Caldalkalibacillus salinus]|uniref:rhamnogalacturonan acetylesterase n=1 Tax=Caldalkalibacillus salinus TaxID=2803787 RepID=UPI0019248C4D|nr:GDSL-type esterase/lipase family protein [Caldalkalibacillus salinus]
MRKAVLMFLTAIVLMVPMTADMIGSSTLVSAKTYPTSFKFDFGHGEVEENYIGVRASDAYDRSKGYGFQTPQYIENVHASGEGVGSDAVEFIRYGTDSTNTFNVDLKNGLYEVQVTLGDTSRASVAAEGVYQIMNMTGNQVTDSFLVPIKDGQLNLLITAGKEGTPFTLSALEIEKLSHSVVMPRTVWIGGDSTVANYYPKDSDELVGWGQVFHQFVDEDLFTVRNMATSGQVAKGFLEDGQMEAILKYIKPGDYFIFEMGINDEKAYSEEMFYQYMKEIVQSAKAKGATVVLVAPQGRAIDWDVDESGPVHDAKDKWYRPTTMSLAEEEGVGFVDLNVLSSHYFTSIGPAETQLLYRTGDYMHFNRQGATVLAELVAEDLQRQGHEGFGD